MCAGNIGSSSSLKNDLSTPDIELMEFESVTSDNGSSPEKERTS